MRRLLAAGRPNRTKPMGRPSLLGLLLIVLLVMFILGGLPTWPYAASWGPYPSGAALLVLIIVLLLLFL